MAVLPDDDRQAVWADFMSDCSRDREVFGAMTKADIRAAVNALDTFFHDNAATINSAIPQPARSVMTTAQKARMISAILNKRYVKGV